MTSFRVKTHLAGRFSAHSLNPCAGVQWRVPAESSWRRRQCSSSCGQLGVPPLPGQLRPRLRVMLQLWPLPQEGKCHRPCLDMSVTGLRILFRALEQIHYIVLCMYRNRSLRHSLSRGRHAAESVRVQADEVLMLHVGGLAQASCTASSGGALLC